MLSIVPPAAASVVGEQLAAAVRSTGATPLVVEANAISPARAEALAAQLGAAGARFVDADVIGGPPAGGRPPTRLYLSGPDAGAGGNGARHPRAACRRPRGRRSSAASSLKMAYAAWTKGSAALVLTARALARRLRGGGGAGRGMGRVPARPGWAPQMAALVSGRAWRFEAEMNEIAAALGAVGLPPGFGEAAAGAYSRLASMKGQVSPSVDEVVGLLVGSNDG